MKSKNRICSDKIVTIPCVGCCNHHSNESNPVKLNDRNEVFRMGNQHTTEVIATDEKQSLYKHILPKKK